MRNTSKDHCAFVSCWAFLCRFLSGFLAGPTCITYRVASGFFCAQTPPRVQDSIFPSRSPMLLSDGSYSQLLSVAERLFARQASTYSLATNDFSTQISSIIPRSIRLTNLLHIQINIQKPSDYLICAFGRHFCPLNTFQAKQKINIFYLDWRKHHGNTDWQCVS